MCKVKNFLLDNVYQTSALMKWPRYRSVNTARPKFDISLTLGYFVCNIVHRSVRFDNSQVRVSVLQMLPSAEVDDLPVVVKFILQSVSDADAFEVMSELRVNLDLNSIIPPAASSTPAEQRRSRGG